MACANEPPCCSNMPHTLFLSLLCPHLEPGGRQQWVAGDSRYDAALQELGTKVCREEERKIYDLVFKLKLLRDDKAQESGNAATKILRRIIKLRS